MHIKEDLVYDKHSDSLIGFANVGDMNNLLNDENPETTPSIASTKLVLMVRGLVSDLNFPYVQFAVLFYLAICCLIKCGKP